MRDIPYGYTPTITKKNFVFKDFIKLVIKKFGENLLVMRPPKPEAEKSFYAENKSNTQNEIEGIGIIFVFMLYLLSYYNFSSVSYILLIKYIYLCFSQNLIY